MTTISIVIPAHNEGDAIWTNLGVILLAAAAINGETAFEVIVVDDGSTDATAAEVQRFARDDARVQLISLSRNFGKESAILAGLDHATGDAVIVMDADLQHPPECIGQMVALWRRGFPVVEAIKRDRGMESLGGKLAAGLFYFLFYKFSGFDLAYRSDYKLLDRAVVEAYRTLPEKRRFFRGLVAWLGYPVAQVPFSVPARNGGESRWSNSRLLRYAVDNLMTFSALPLHVVSWLGAASLLLGVVIGSVSLYQKWQGEALDGFTTVILLLIFFSGALMLSLGVIGHYIACIYEEIKQRPHYVLRPRDEEHRPDQSA